MYVEGEWRSVPLGDHANVSARIGWKGLNANEYLDEGYRFLATPNIKGLEIDFDNVNFISERRYCESPELMLRPNDVLLVKDGSTLGISNIIRVLPSPATINGSIALLRCSESLCPTFLHQLTKARAFQKLVQDKKSGLGVPHLFQADLRKFEIPLPPLQEQRQIGEILDTLDTIIRRTDAIIEKFKQVKHGLLHDLLTRGIDANGELRPPQSQAPHLYQDSRLGVIPREWGSDTLGRLAESSVIGPFGSDLVASDYRPQGVPVVFVRDVKADHFEWKSNVFVSSQKALALSAHGVQGGDVVATKMGLPPCVAAVYPKSMPSGIVTADIVRLRFDAGSVRPHWVSLSINEAAVVKQVEQITAGVTRPKVTLRDVRNLCIRLPPLKEQDCILARIASIDEQIDGETTVLSKLRLLKAGLMDDLLTGRVRVTPLLA